MTTRAIKFLKQKKVPFDVLKYDHTEKGAAFAAQATGMPLERTIKTLVVDTGPKSYHLALVAGDRQLSLKKMARACGVKRAAMADTRSAERLTGYLIGGISPFATRQRLPVIMDAFLLNYANVAINAGQRGILLAMTPTDILDILAGDVDDITDV
jgi:Cys-tRNA(Pro)/Cys-tRNA(Cys) deacylase